MEKLVCDRCNLEYTDKESIEMAKQHENAWATMCRDTGIEPRGIIACPDIQCTGELLLKEV